MNQKAITFNLLDTHTFSYAGDRYIRLPNVKRDIKTDYLLSHKRYHLLCSYY